MLVLEYLKMWNESLVSGNSQGRLLAPNSADSMDSPASRRVSAASDDSFDASSYVHVDNKLNNKMPKCLISCDTGEKALENHFTKTSTAPTGSGVTKSGKRVIRKRLSVSEFRASRLKANINNNSNTATRKLRNNEGDILNSSSSDNDTLPKTKKRNTDVLSAKIQHLLFEMVSATYYYRITFMSYSSKHYTVPMTLLHQLGEIRLPFSPYNTPRKLIFETL